MKVLIAYPNKLPTFAYGGTERVVWDLAKALVSFGHEVELLVKEGSTCTFAKVHHIKDDNDLLQKISSLKFDIAHLHLLPNKQPDFPYIFTEHGNSKIPRKLPLNTVFVSADHARRYGATAFVHNGLDWATYGKPDFASKQNYFHFLGHGAWRVKNLRGAIKVAHAAKKELQVLGGKRFNLTRGIRLTFSPHVHFHGMVGGEKKLELLRGSRGLIFPVRWHEPFGLAVIESMYMGCPVYGTPYGALPEIVTNECGYLAPSGAELVAAINNNHFDPEACHERAKSMFNHIKMGQAYEQIYKKVVAGEKLQQHEPILLENGHKLIDWSM